VKAKDFPFADYYEMVPQPQQFDLVDIGCGYGDFVKNMSLLHPDTCMMGLEIRDKAVAIA